VESYAGRVARVAIQLELILVDEAVTHDPDAVEQGRTRAGGGRGHHGQTQRGAANLGDPMSLHFLRNRS
jgi:hypothetical protein